MDPHALQLPPHHQVILDRFVTACQADARVVAAFLGGSYAGGTADAYSDLDFGLITTDAAYEDFRAGRASFIRLLGEPVFVEDFDLPYTLFVMFSSGTECEFAVARAGQFHHMHRGPYRVLLDTTGVLAGVAFRGEAHDQAAQLETLRRLIVWFWHDVAHFITAMGRGQLWWAYGQLEVLRRSCVSLVRLRQNVADADVGAEGYFKLEQVIPVAQLSSLQVTYCPMEQRPMLQAALAIVRCYQDVASPLARTHGITYPHALERVLLDRLENVCHARGGR